MTDVKIQNGDVALDSARRMIRLSGKDAQFQRAVISATVGRGSFIYDRALGCRYGYDRDDEFSARKVGLSINEALARFKNTSARVLDINESITLEINIDGESRTEEVRLIGNV